MIVICREVCRDTGKIAAYPLKTEVTDSLLNKLRMRSAFNPELQYYVTLATIWDANRELIIRQLRRRGKVSILGVEEI